MKAALITAVSGMMLLAYFADDIVRHFSLFVIPPLMLAVVLVAAGVGKHFEGPSVDAR